MKKKFYFTTIFVFAITLTVISQSLSHYNMKNYENYCLTQDFQKSNFLPDSAMRISYLNNQIDTSYEYYTYNSNDLLVKKESHSEMFGMNLILRDQYTYNSLGVLIEVFVDQRILPLPTWDNVFRERFIYDAYGNLLSGRAESWNISWSVLEGDSSFYTYSGANVEEWEQFEYNTASQMWEKTEKVVFTAYNSNNEPVEACIFEWDGTSWGDTALKYSNVIWALGFNGFGLETEPTDLLVYEKSSGSWVNLQKTTSTISNNRVTEALTEEWNGSSWDNEERKLYDYDIEDNLITEKHQEWNGNWGLISGDSTVINYGTLGEKLYSFNYFFDKNFNLQWNEAHEFFYYYAPNIGIDKFQDNNSVEVFPNPANHYIDLKLDANRTENIVIEIYNNIGERVFVSSKNANIESPYRIDISDMESGLYFVKIHSSSTKKSMKFIKL